MNKDERRRPSVLSRKRKFIFSLCPVFSIRHLLILVSVLQLCILFYLHSRVDDTSTPPCLSCIREERRHASIITTLTSSHHQYHLGTIALLDHNHSPRRFRINNPFPRDRFVCDQIIPKSSTKEVIIDPESCKESVPRLYPNTPTLSSAIGMPPIVVQFSSRGDRDIKEMQQCDVPCQYYGATEGQVVSYPYVEGTRWRFTWSMEGSQYYPETKIDPHSDQKDQDHYYATTSFQSEIPLPYYSEELFYIQHPAVDFDKAIKGASFLARNCESHSGRESVVVKLLRTKRIRIDALSDCLHNANFSSSVRDHNNKTQVMQSYLFHLAFENSIEDDYITEKLWAAYASGTLPVYFGAKNVKQHVPPNSIIVVGDFSSPTYLAAHLAKLARNKTLYESYHAWRRKPLDQAFVQKYQFTKIHSTCRLCRWAYAKKYGFGFNQSSQRVQETVLPRKTCIDQDGLLSKPMKEEWVIGDGTRAISSSIKDQTVSCGIGSANRSVNVANGRVQRTVWDQDGVTDLLVSYYSDYIDMHKIRLRLHVPLAIGEIEFKLVGKRQYQLQDGHSRIIVLTSEECSGLEFVPHGRVIEIPLPKEGRNELLRIRIIIEDLDLFHDVAARNQVGDFAYFMMDDFFNPVRWEEVL
jgi:hypothetical protein